jgi:hypothetical protein
MLRKSRDLCLIRPDLDEPHHVEKVLAAEAVAILGR